jgi:hypothetical protein
MDVTIIETGEQEELGIIDPKSGVNWINDLMGNYGALPEYDGETGTYKMTREEFNWWAALTKRYQAADNRYHRLEKDLDDDKSAELIEAAHSINVDLEDFPAALQDVCDQFEN